MIDKDQQWYYRIDGVSDDDEDYVVTCTNRIAAINDARDHIKENFDHGTEVKFSIGRCQHPITHCAGFEIFSDVVEYLDGEILFGSGESGCLSMSPANIYMLDQIVFDFIRKNASVEHWVYDDPAEETHFCKGCQ